MVQVQITPQQRELLIEILKSDLSDLRMEIADTDSSVFKDQLRARKQMLLEILEAVSASGAEE